MMEINFAGLHMDNCNVWFDPSPLNYLNNQLPKRLQYAKSTYYEPYELVNQYKGTKVNICDYAETESLRAMWDIDNKRAIHNVYWGYEELIDPDNDEWAEVDPPVIELWMHGTNWNPERFTFPWNVTHPRINDSTNFSGIISYSKWAWNFSNMFSGCTNLQAPFGVPTAVDIDDNLIGWHFTPYMQHWSNKDYDEWFYAIKQNDAPYWSIYGKKFPEGYNCAYMFSAAKVAGPGPNFIDGGNISVGIGSLRKTYEFDGIGNMSPYHHIDPSDSIDGHRYMFNNCYRMFAFADFTSFGNWSIHANVTANMFEGFYNVRSPGNYNVLVRSNNADAMYANAFTDVSENAICRFDFSGGRTSRYAFFNSYITFNNSVDWEIESDCVEMFANAKGFNANTIAIGYLMKTVNEHIPEVSCNNAFNMFSNAGGGVITLADGDRFNRAFNPYVRVTSPSVTNIAKMFLSCGNFNKLVIFDEPFYDSEYAFANCISFNEEIILPWMKAGTSEYTINAAHMFHHCSSLEKFPFVPLESGILNTAQQPGMDDSPTVFDWGKSRGYYSDYISISADFNLYANMAYMFADCSSYDDECMCAEIDNSAYIYVSTTNASHMMDNCRVLNTCPNVSFGNESQNADLSYMFHNCWAFNNDAFDYGRIVDGERHSYVNNISGMFSNCIIYDQILTIYANSGSSVGNVDASYLFEGCTNLNKAVHFYGYIDEESSSECVVTNMDGMYSGCVNYNTQTIIPNGVISTVSMFRRCNNFSNKSIWLPPSLKRAMGMFQWINATGQTSDSIYIDIYLQKRGWSQGTASDLNVSGIFEKAYSQIAQIAPYFRVHAVNDEQLAPFLKTGSDSVVGHPISWSAINMNGNGYQYQGSYGNIWLYNNYVV